MRTRKLRFGLYADEEGLAWVRESVGREAGARGARIVDETVLRAGAHSGRTTAELCDFLAEQWAVENPGRSSGTREAVVLDVRLVCSLRTYRAVRKAALRALCPEGAGPHTCRVPWSAW
ncbi:hypothetical protein ACFWUZ_04035 [Streptomyces sp. NPDC058646]|uniref:hypothetical protein n=1 Tax=Streptomyces sp. NPDC058646 TaxID=3346574 RepID=UPI003660241E